MKSSLLTATLLAFLVLPASAQTSMYDTQTMITGYATTNSSSSSRIGSPDDQLAARDGCMNIPGVAHNSADCSVITWMDPDTKLPDKPLNQLSGAEENLIRSYNILVKDQQAGLRPKTRALSVRR